MKGKRDLLAAARKTLGETVPASGVVTTKYQRVTMTRERACDWSGVLKSPLLVQVALVLNTTNADARTMVPERGSAAQLFPEGVSKVCGERYLSVSSAAAVDTRRVESDGLSKSPSLTRHQDGRRA